MFHTKLGQDLISVGFDSAIFHWFKATVFLARHLSDDYLLLWKLRLFHIYKRFKRVYITYLDVVFELWSSINVRKGYNQPTIRLLVIMARNIYNVRYAFGDFFVVFCCRRSSVLLVSIFVVSVICCLHSCVFGCCLSGFYCPVVIIIAGIGLLVVFRWVIFYNSVCLSY